MNIDLFGNIVDQKKFTSTQKLSIRQTNFEGRDLYTTEPKDIKRFLDALKEDGLVIPSPIWEPAAGFGDISKTLIKYGYEVKSSDLYCYQDDLIKIIEADFFVCSKNENCKTIFTNPPFNMQEKFLLHALSMNIDVIFFVRLNFLSSIRRYKIYQTYKPAYVYIYSARAHCYKNGEKTGKTDNMIDYCLIWWKPPYRNEPILRWIV